MIKKFFIYFIPAMLLVAIFLKSAGIDELSFDRKYFEFFTQVMYRQHSWSIEIPIWQPIEEADFVINGFDLTFIAKGINFFIMVVNILTRGINLFVSVVTFLSSMFVQIYESIRGLFIGNNAGLLMV